MAVYLTNDGSSGTPVVTVSGGGPVLDYSAIVQSAVTITQEIPPIPYAYGGGTLSGPSLGSDGLIGFDCSSFVRYCYYIGTGGGADIGRTTVDQMPNGNMVVAPADVSTSSFSDIVSTMQPGDLIFYGATGSSGGDAHVQMYIGNGEIAQAERTGTNVMSGPVPTNFEFDTSEPFAGVFRYYGTAGVSGSAIAAATAASTVAATAASSAPVQADSGATDPRNNLPFSPFFMGQTVGNGSGGFKFNAGVNNTKNIKSLDTALVRGGMSQLQTNNPGQAPSQAPFQVYFMMNPATIEVDYNISTTMGSGSNLPPSVAAQQRDPLVSMQCVFTVYFNRMYEVWQGGTPGPSDIGVRWDTRAIERLMGMYDDTSGPNNGPNYGISNYGNGANVPVVSPIQVVFGTKNAMRFQGYIQGLDVTYTMFSKDMVPVECEVDLTVMWYYTTSGITTDLSTPLVQTYTADGSYVAGSSATAGVVPIGLSPVYTSSTSGLQALQ